MDGARKHNINLSSTCLLRVTDDTKNYRQGLLTQTDQLRQVLSSDANAGLAGHLTTS